MLWSQEKISIAYLSGGKLTIAFFKNKNGQAVLTQLYEVQFSESEAADYKVGDPHLFSKKLTAFLDEKRLDLGNLIIVLPDEAVFIKGFDLGQEIPLAQLKQQFVGEIPYSISELALKTIIDDGLAQLIAVEKNTIANLRVAFAAEMANVQLILPLPRIVSLSLPQEDVAIVFLIVGLRLTALLLKKKTVIFSATRKLEDETNLEHQMTSLIEELTALVDGQDKPTVVFLNIDAKYQPIVRNLGFEVKELDSDFSVWQLVANLWFRHKAEIIGEDLTLETDQYSIPNPALPKWFGVMVKIVVLGVIIGGGLWGLKEFVFPQAKILFTKEKAHREQATDTARLPILPTASPSATPAPPVVSRRRSDFRIEVLNGNGIGGDAARFKQVLESEDFVVESIGNADSGDYKFSEINAKSSVPADIISAIDKLLNQSYTQVKISTLSADAKVDVRVILGEKR